jgi:hypothetical protein
MRRALLVAALLLAACAAPETESPSATLRPSFPPGFERIAATYLDLIAVGNAATCNFNAVLSQSAPALADLKRASSAYAFTIEKLAKDLAHVDWPTSVRADAFELVDALLVDRALAAAMGAAETLDAFIEADNQLIEANKTSAAAATQLRHDLGLGPAGNPCS